MSADPADPLQAALREHQLLRGCVADLGRFLQRARCDLPGLGASQLVRCAVLVDDDAAMLRGAGRMLERLGYSMRWAAAAAALESCSREPIDVLVTDVHMPGKSGVRLAEQLRAICRALPVLFITGHANEPIEATARQSVLSTPFRISRLQQALHALLEPDG